MPKQPAFQFYPGDWLRDVGVQSASLETKGFWIDALCRMWDAPDRGILEGTRVEICRLMSCTDAELQACLDEIVRLKIGHVINGPENVRIINRRMRREQDTRDRWKKAKRAERERKGVIAKSSLYSSSSFSSSKKQDKKTASRPYKKLCEQLNEICKQIRISSFNPYQVITKFESYHPDAIEHVLRSIAKNQKKIKNGWAYFKHSIEIEHQNYNEADAIAAHRQLKLEWDLYFAEKKETEEPVTRLRQGPQIPHD